MKKKNIIVICVVLILVVALIIFSFLLSNGYSLELEERYIVNCQKDCGPDPREAYPTIVMKGINEEFEKIIKEVNKETDKVYEKTLNSKVDSSECSSEIKEKYKYRYEHLLDHRFGEKDNYVTFAYQRSMLDLCTGENEISNPVAYIYSKKGKKLISQKELLKAFNIDEYSLQISIKSAILLHNRATDETGEKLEEPLDYKYAEKDGKLYSLAFLIQDELFTFYYQSNTDSYYVAKLSHYDSE